MLHRTRQFRLVRTLAATNAIRAQLGESWMAALAPPPNLTCAVIRREFPSLGHGPQAGAHDQNSPFHRSSECRHGIGETVAFNQFSINKPGSMPVQPNPRLCSVRQALAR
jgi:hypothetical protein